MPGACRLGDVGSGHASWPPTNVITSCSTVIIEGKLAARIGDSLEPHASPSPNPVHSRTISGGSSNVIVEGSGQSYTGSSIDCGGLMMTSAATVVIN